MDSSFRRNDGIAWPQPLFSSSTSENSASTTSSPPASALSPAPASPPGAPAAPAPGPRPPPRAAPAPRRPRRAGGLVLLVDRLAELHRDLGEVGGFGLHVLGIAALDGRLGFRHRALDLGLEARVDLVAMLGELPLGAVDEAFGVVLRLGRVAA